MMITPARTVFPDSAVRFLSAPPGEYMSAPQLAYFQGLLHAERDSLIQSAHDTEHHLQEFEATPDPSDRASVEEDHSLELRVRDRERKHMHTIDAVLQRIEDGRYGWCEETGEPIGLARLLARPTATLSLEAQLRHESRRRMQA